MVGLYLRIHQQLVPLQTQISKQRWKEIPLKQVNSIFYSFSIPLPLSSQQSLKVVGFDDPLIARVPYDLYEARARDSVIRMDGSATRTPAVYAAGELWV